MTISQRVLGGAAVLLLLTIALGLYSFQRLQQVRESSGIVTREALPTIIVANEIRSLVKENFVNTYQHAITATEDTARFGQIETDMKAGSAQITELYAELEKLIVDEEDRTAMAAILAARKEYTGKRGELLKISRELPAEQMETHLREQLLPRYRTYIGAIEQFVELHAAEGRGAGELVDGTVAASRRLVLIGTLVATLVGSVGSILSTRFIARALRSVSSQLTESSAQVASAATQVSSSSQSLAGGASEQAASLEETSASLEEISSMTKRNAESAVEANGLANQTRAAAETGAADVQAMNDAMGAIKSSSDNIAKIIKTIDEIAFQTNILALNAAVEAARAGDAGAGFAVVADEVRALAQRSAQAARETAEKIEDAIQKSAHGVRISTKVAASLQQIVEKARSVDSLVGEISSASREQSDGIGQVLTAVTQMDKVTQGNAALAEESAAAAEELTAQACSLDEIVGQLQRLTGSAKSAPARNARVAAHTASTKTASRGSDRFDKLKAPSPSRGFPPDSGAVVRPTVGHSSFAEATEDTKARPTTAMSGLKAAKVEKPAGVAVRKSSTVATQRAARKPEPVAIGAEGDSSLDQFFK